MVYNLTSLNVYIYKNLKNQKHKNLHLLRSFINGSHGEYTGMDDLDRAPGAARLAPMLAAGVQLERQLARGGRRARNILGPRERARNADARVNNRNILPAQPNAAVDLPLIPDVRVRKAHIGNVNGLEGYVFEDQYYTDPVYEVIQPGIYDNVQNSGPGWVSFGPKGREHVYVGPKDSVYAVQEHYRDQNFIPRRQWVLFCTLVDRLKNKVRATEITDSGFKAIQSSCDFAFKNIPQSVIDSCKDYIYHCVLYNQVKFGLLQRGIVDMTHRNPYAVLEVYDNDAEQTVSLCTASKIYSEVCNIVFEYEVDPDIVVEGDVVFENVGGNDRPQLRFLPDLQNVHWYQTCMFSLEGATKFTQYDDNDINKNQALKRLIAKSDNHDVRVHNQAYCAKLYFDEMIYKGYRANELAQVCGVDMRAEPFEDDFVHDLALEARMHTSINTLCSIINEHFNRTWLDFVLSIVPEMANWAYLETKLGFMEYIEPIFSRRANADIVHVKRELRRAYVKFRGMHGVEDIMVTRLEGKLKNELAKFQSAPRLVVGYDAGCMYANELPEFVKVCMQTEYTLYRNGIMFYIYMFSKPRIKEINDVFNRICNGMESGQCIICIYSDDSVWHLAGENGFSVNADISACDQSVQEFGFLLTSHAMGNFDYDRTIGLVMQCKLPINIRDRSGTRGLSISRNRGGIQKPIEGSGTVLTTVNNFFIMLASVIFYIELGNYTTEGIIFSGLCVGINLKISPDFRHVPERLQFLKLSPILCDNQRYYMVRNLGCILRGLGKINGDMNPQQLGMSLTQFNTTPWDERMNLFVSSVVAGYVHEPGCYIMDALRDRFAVPTSKIVESHVPVETAPPECRVLEESLGRRYNLTPEDFGFIAESIRSIRLGNIVVDDRIGSIYREDYGLA
jgi:hypothetical protein